MTKFTFQMAHLFHHKSQVVNFFYQIYNLFEQLSALIDFEWLPFDWDNVHKLTVF